MGKNRQNPERKVYRRELIKVPQVEADLIGLVLKEKKENMGRRNRAKMRKVRTGNIKISTEAAQAPKLHQGVHRKMIEEGRKRGGKKRVRNQSIGKMMKRKGKRKRHPKRRLSRRRSVRRRSELRRNNKKRQNVKKLKEKNKNVSRKN